MVSVKKFYTEWCGPCKVLTPVMENVKSKFSQVQFENVDIDSQFEFQSFTIGFEEQSTTSEESRVINDGS